MKLQIGLAMLVVPVVFGQSISSISPTSTAAGGPSFTLTVNGSGFVSGIFNFSSVDWNGSSLTTSFVSTNQLNAIVPASLIAQPGSANITVVNPGGSTSNTVTFTITASNGGPTLSSLNPSSATPGGPGFTLTVNGAGFQNGATVDWNGSGLSTGFISVNQMSAFVPANLIATAGTASVTVMNPGGALSNALTFTIGSTNTPVLTSLNPSSATPGGSAFTLTVNGSGFLNGATVQWNGSGLSTGFISGSQVSAFVPANLIATAGTASVTVMNPVGAASNALTFTIGSTNAPVLTSLNPNSATPGGSAFTLTVNGSGFLNGATVQWNGSALSTGFISGNQVSAFVPANLIATAGTSSVTVMNPGGAVSNTLTFTIGSAPILTSLAPASAIPGGPAFNLTVNGSGFFNGAVVQWNGSALSTGFVNANQLTAFVPGSLIATSGSASITVMNPGGAVSNALTFTIGPGLAPTLSSLSPYFAPAGGSAFTLTVFGSGFLSGVVVQWNGTALSTSFGATQVTAFVPANLIAFPGNASITAVNPGGAVSNTLTFNVTPAGTPTLSSLSPNTLGAGGGTFTLAVNGSNFANGAVVQWNGVALGTSFVASTQLNATVPATLIAAPGSANVTVVNPGGATSNTLVFTITTASGVTLSSLSPNSASAGGPGFTLTALGSGFANGANLEWNGAVLSTNFVSATQLSASVPSILIANPGTATITVVNPGGGTSNALTFSTFGFSSALRVAQIADGSNWKTLFQVVNLDVTPVNFAFQFWDDNGNSLALPLVNGSPSPFSGTLPVGGTAFAETPGTAAALTQGWAEAASGGKIGVLTIFRQIVPGRPDSEGTVTGVLSGSKVFLPFDDTNGYVTGVAIANTNPTQTLFVTLTFAQENGSQSTGALSLPPHGHTAFVLTSMFPALSGVRGSVEFTASTPDIAVVGLRFSPNNSFTSLGEFQ
jgi:hypothetical protein